MTDPNWILKVCDSCRKRRKCWASDGKNGVRYKCEKCLHPDRFGKEEVRIPVFICKACGGVYGYTPVTQCDCMPDKNEFYKGVAVYYRDKIGG